MKRNLNNIPLVVNRRINFHKDYAPPYFPYLSLSQWEVTIMIDRQINGLICFLKLKSYESLKLKNKNCAQLCNQFIPFKINLIKNEN